MRLFTVVSVLLCVVTSVLGQTIGLGAPAEGEVLHQGQDFTAQVILPTSLVPCYQIGIALTIANCNQGVCPTPDQGLGHVFYHGPWSPTPALEDGFYQNFTFQVPDIGQGPAVFTVTHLCLIDPGAGPFPFLEFRNVTVRIEY